MKDLCADCDGKMEPRKERKHPEICNRCFDKYAMIDARYKYDLACKRANRKRQAWRRTRRLKRRFAK